MKSGRSIGKGFILSFKLIVGSVSVAEGCRSFTEMGEGISYTHAADYLGIELAD